MKNERGFTLPELIAVTVLILLLLGAAMVILRKANYTVVERDAERRLELAALSRGTAKYIAANGQLPDLPTKATPIGSYEGQYDLCSITVPDYSQDMPLDPLNGAKVTYDENDSPKATDADCNVEGVDYTTGYTIHKNSKGQVVLGLEKAEKESITFTMPNP